MTIDRSTSLDFVIARASVAAAIVDVVENGYMKLNKQISPFKCARQSGRLVV